MNHRFTDYAGTTPANGGGLPARQAARTPPPPPSAGARDQLRSTLDRTESFVSAYPGACLAAAMAAGVLIGWWIKRR